MELATTVLFPAAAGTSLHSPQCVCLLWILLSFLSKWCTRTQSKCKSDYSFASRTEPKNAWNFAFITQIRIRYVGPDTRRTLHCAFL
jgi:hypothetical protein